MKVGQICSRQVEVIGRSEPLARAAHQMRDRDVGALIVVAPETGRVVGILTDRDIVCQQIELKKDLHCLSVEDAMTPDPLIIGEDSDLSDAIRALNGLGVRRAPVVDGQGALVGIVTVDDLVPAVAQQLLNCAQLLSERVEPSVAMAL